MLASASRCGYRYCTRRRAPFWTQMEYDRHPATKGTPPRQSPKTPMSAEDYAMTAQKRIHHVSSSTTIMDELLTTHMMLQPEAIKLNSLSADVILHVCDDCSLADLLALSGSCRALRALLDAYHTVWETVIRRRHREVIQCLFAGIVPMPPRDRSWKRHVVEFDREWLDMARRRSGRMLLRMSSDCALSHPGYLGVPPPVGTFVRFPVALPPLLRFHVCLDVPSFGGGGATCHGIFDATDFADRHPGADQILRRAAAESDCTQGFDAANHTERARTILRRLVVPGLEAITEPPPLARPRPRALAKAVGAILGRLRALCSTLRALPATLAILWAVAAQVARYRGSFGTERRASEKRP